MASLLAGFWPLIRSPSSTIWSPQTGLFTNRYGAGDVTKCLSEDCTVVLVQHVTFDAQIQDTSIAG